MLSALLASLLAAAAGAKDESLAVTLCKKACILPHDASVIACKTVKNKGWWATKKCVWEAARKKRACEANCAKK